jgi:hypothetical protein
MRLRRRGDCTRRRNHQRRLLRVSVGHFGLDVSRELGPHLLQHRLDVAHLEGAQLLEEAVDEHAVHQQVDLARHAARMRVHAVVHLRCERRRAVPADGHEPEADVALRLLEAQRLEVMGDRDALAQLAHPRPAQRLLQLRLPDEEDLQERAPARLEIGEDAQLLQCRLRQRLRLVDDEDDALQVIPRVQQRLLEIAQHELLALALERLPQGRRDGGGDALRLQVRRRDARGGDRLVRELCEQRLDQQRLAGADVARDDDESLRLLEPVTQVRHGALVRAARVQEAQIGCELEGLAGEAVEAAIHDDD